MIRPRGFINNDMWVANTSGCGSSFCWIEDGIFVGTVCNYALSGNAACQAGHLVEETQPTYFWADNRPGGGFHLHLCGTAALSQPDYVSIGYVANGTWSIDNNGCFNGQSTNTFTSSNYLESGTETDNPSITTACSTQTSLQWESA